MKNLNAEQVVKALKYCTDGGRCLDCRYDKGNSFTKEGCMASHMRDALALINSQEQRIKELGEEKERLKLDVEVCGAELSRYTENIVQMAKQDRADTVQNIQLRLAVHFGTYTDTDMVKVADVFRLLDKIANEMLEEMHDE